MLGLRSRIGRRSVPRLSMPVQLLFAVVGMIGLTLSSATTVPAPGEALIAGGCHGSIGTPMGNARVEVRTPTMRYVTWTDRHGAYAFRPPSFPRGTHTLVARGRRETISYTGTPLKVNLVLAARSR